MCKAKNVALAYSWRARNKEKWKTYLDAYNRKRLYGLSETQYQNLLKQYPYCAICCAPWVTSPNIDHCHQTNKVRGLLCKDCNTGLGHFKDDIANLQSAIVYLSSSPVAA